MACHLQIDADPDPAYHFDADPDAYPDLGYYFDSDADPDPQYVSGFTYHENIGAQKPLTV